jgi:hypothetical protein
MRENPGECDCCGFVTKKLQKFADQDTTIAGGGKTRKDDFWYCDLCCSTPASTYSRYPGQQASNTVVLQTICYVGNEILKALKRRS